MSGRRSALVAALAFTLRVAALHAAPGKELDTPRLAVVVNDYAGAEPAVLELAKSHVILIYRGAGVAVDWVDREDPRLDDQAFLKSIVTGSLYSEEMDDRSDVRDAVVGKAPPGGRTVKVLYHRLEEIRSGRTPEAAFLLGNVIAHEIRPPPAAGRSACAVRTDGAGDEHSHRDQPSAVLHACGAQTPPQRVDICGRRLTRRAVAPADISAPAMWEIGL